MARRSAIVTKLAVVGGKRVAFGAAVNSGRTALQIASAVNGWSRRWRLESRRLKTTTVRAGPRCSRWPAPRSPRRPNGRSRPWSTTG